jgi:hypothetical protein
MKLKTSFDEFKSESNKSTSYFLGSLGFSSMDRRAQYPDYEERFERLILNKTTNMLEPKMLTAANTKYVEAYLLANSEVLLNTMVKIHSENILDSETDKPSFPREFLCRKTLGRGHKCPICEQYSQAKAAGTKDSFPFKATSTICHVPLLVTNNTELKIDPETRQTIGEFSRFMFLKVKVTDYQAEAQQNMDRLIALTNDPKSVTNTIEVISLSRKSGELAEYYYKTTENCPIIPQKDTEHPLFNDDWLYINDDTGAIEFDTRYVQLMAAITTAMYLRPINPITKKPIDFATEDDEDIIDQATAFIDKEIQPENWNRYTLYEEK